MLPNGYYRVIINFEFFKFKQVVSSLTNTSFESGSSPFLPDSIFIPLVTGDP